MPFEFTTLLENLQLTHSMLLDTRGQEISALETLKAYHEFYRTRREQGLIPKYYKTPLGCQMELTYRCNQYCITCYNRSGGDRNQWPSLSLAEWKKVAEELVELGVFQCVMSGGEPLLLGDDLFQIMDILHDAKVKFIFITNGMLLTPQTVEKLSKYRYDWFQVSMDGSRPEVHDFVRGVKSWHKAVRGAAMIHEAGIPLVIAHVVLKQNFHLLEEMIDLAYFIGANQILVGPVEYSGRATENYGKIALSEEQKKQLYSIVKKKHDEYAHRINVRITVDEVLSFRYHIVEGNGVLLVRPNGDVKFDCILPYIIGNVRKQSLREIWETIGHKVYEHPIVQDCVCRLKCEEDVLTCLPDIDSAKVHLNPEGEFGK